MTMAVKNMIVNFNGMDEMKWICLTFRLPLRRIVYFWWFLSRIRGHGTMVPPFKTQRLIMQILFSIPNVQARARFEMFIFVHDFFGLVSAFFFHFFIFPFDFSTTSLINMSSFAEIASIGCFADVCMLDSCACSTRGVSRGVAQGQGSYTLL